MNNEFINEAYRFLNLIYDTIDPSLEWVIINARYSQDTNKENSIDPYTFKFRGVPEYLEKTKSIEAVRKGVVYEDHFILNKKFRGYELFLKDQIDDEIWLTLVGAKKIEYGADFFINYGQALEGYGYEDSEGVVTYPIRKDSNERYAILIFPRMLERHLENPYNKLHGFQDGILSIAGNAISFKGIQSKLVEKLYHNLNSIVSYEELYKARGIEEENFDRDLIRLKKTKIHRIIKDSCSEIKAKIRKDKFAKNLVFLIESKGYGMFIDKSAIQRVSAENQ